MNEVFRAGSGPICHVWATTRRNRKPKEHLMNRFNQTHMLTAAAAFGAVAFFSILTLDGSAEASTGLLSCQGDTAKKVVSCCEQIILKKRPLWMRQTQTSCHAAVVCKVVKVYGSTSLTHVSAPKTKKVCSIVKQAKNDNGDNHKEPKKERETPNNGPNTPNNVAGVPN